MLSNLIKQKSLTINTELRSYYNNMNIDSIAPMKILKDHIYSISRAEMKYHPHDPSTEIALCTDIDVTDNNNCNDTHTEKTEDTNGSQSDTEGPLQDYAKEPTQPQDQSSQDTQATGQAHV